MEQGISHNIIYPWYAPEMKTVLKHKQLEVKAHTNLMAHWDLDIRDLIMWATTKLAHMSTTTMPQLQRETIKKTIKM